MSDDSNDHLEADRIVPVFPLTDTVFFPHTSLPLHIFEPRYREMVRDVTAGDGLIVISRKVGDDFETLATVGRVRDLQPLEDGRYNLRLEGLERVVLTEVTCDTPYRQARIEPRPEEQGSNDPKVIERSKLELLATLGILLSVANEAVPVVLDQDLPFEVVVNKACAGLPVESVLRQELLAENDFIGRQRLVSHHLNDVIKTVAQLGLDEDSGDGSLVH